MVILKLYLIIPVYKSSMNLFLLLDLSLVFGHLVLFLSNSGNFGLNEGHCR